MTHTFPPPSAKRDRSLGVTYAVLAAVGFSAKAILVKLAYRDAVDAVTLLALRMVFSAPFFAAVALWSQRKDEARLTRGDWLAVVGLGLVGYYLASLFDFLGLQYISAGLERLILFLYPTLTVILSALIARRPITGREMAAMALGYGGIALVVLHDLGQNRGSVTLGSLLVFGSCVTYAIYLVGAGHAIARLGSTRFTAYALIVSTIAILAQFGLTHPLAQLALPLRVYGLAFAMAVLCTVLPAFLLSAAIRHLGAGPVSLIGSLGPVATIALAWMVLNESMSVQQIAGSALVLAGVVAVSRSGKRAAK